LGCGNPLFVTSAFPKVLPEKELIKAEAQGSCKIHFPILVQEVSCFNKTPATKKIKFTMPEFQSSLVFLQMKNQKRM
jgi:hypothetical protein